MFEEQNESLYLENAKSHRKKIIKSNLNQQYTKTKHPSQLEALKINQKDRNSTKEL